MDVSFSDLLHRAQQLTSDMETGTELPRIQRNFPQLAEASNRLLSKTWSATGDAADVKASLLLSAKGVEVPKLSQKLESLDATKTFDPIEPIIETDVHSFLKNERENSILAAIEKTKRRTFELAEKNFQNSLENEWEKEKQKILNSLLGAGKEAMRFPVDAGKYDEFTMTKGRSSLGAVEMAFARQVYVYNESSVQKQKQSGAFEAFKQVGEKSEDQNAKDLWLFFEELLPNIGVNKEKNVSKWRQSTEFQRQLLSCSQKFLEDRYRNFIEKTVYENLQKAQLGGVPGLYNLVLSYLKIRLPANAVGYEDGTVGGIPVWPLVYYCLRCGNPDATQKAAESLPPQYDDFKMFLKEYLASSDNRLHPNNEAKIRLQYKRLVRTSPDPYKRIVYCMVGRCDMTNTHPDVVKKTEDYLWLKLKQVELSGEATQDSLTLQTLQKLLLEEYGESHFKAFDQPYLYCQVLFLTGQFEAGIEFLSRVDHCRSHAVHLAIVLNSRQLLLSPDLIHSPLLSVDPVDVAPLKRLNFARLITIYTRKFEISDPREALEYFYLLRNFTGPNGENLFASCVSELALETKEFETILGCVNGDGSKKPGCISKFKVDMSNVVGTVAKSAEAKGQFEEATLLYDLADNHEKVLELLTCLLCQLVPLASSPQSSRERVQNMARAVAERYKRQGHTGSRTRSSTFYLLLDLMYFFDLYHQQQTDASLDVIEKLKLIPLNVDEVENKLTAFKQYGEEVRQCLPDVLLATMNILHDKYKKTKASLKNTTMRLTDEKDESYLSSVRSEARALVTFAGLMPYRMPGDCNARLVQLEILMN